MTDEETPFHDGELMLQERLGARERVHKYAPRMIRPFMPLQHQDFFAALPHFFVGAVDEAGNPWASVLWGRMGFLDPISPTELRIGALPGEDDPLRALLREGLEMGAVGMMLHNRRRNRLNGRVSHVGEDGFSLHVTQSFGNCPQYIHAREIGFRQGPENRRGGATAVRDSLTAEDRAMIERADTFFIASASARLGSDDRRGADMSHRGGAPGFVKYMEDGSLLIPDFSGNQHFNTLGNILETAKAGLLFIDFERGDLLQLTGDTTIIWPEDSEWQYHGAERYIRLVPEKVVSRSGVMPFVWQYLAASPMLPNGAFWRQLA